MNLIIFFERPRKKSILKIFNNFGPQTRLTKINKWRILFKKKKKLKCNLKCRKIDTKIY